MSESNSLKAWNNELDRLYGSAWHEKAAFYLEKRHLTQAEVLERVMSHGLDGLEIIPIRTLKVVTEGEEPRYYLRRVNQTLEGVFRYHENSIGKKFRYFFRGTELTGEELVALVFCHLDTAIETQEVVEETK